MKTPQPTDTDDRLTAMALRLARSRGRGPRPDLAEIEGFRNGSLDPARRAEVLSHLARDPACFLLLQELEQAEQQLRAVREAVTAATGSNKLAAESGAQPDAVLGAIPGASPSATEDPAPDAPILPPRMPERQRRRQAPTPARWRTRHRRHLGRAGGLASALAAMLALVAVLPMLPVYRVQLDLHSGYGALGPGDLPAPGTWPTSAPPIAMAQPKGFGFDRFPVAPKQDSNQASARRTSPNQRQAFRAGVRAGLEDLAPAPGPTLAPRLAPTLAPIQRRWLRIIDGLPAAAPSCPLPQRRCRAHLAAAEATGRWAVLVFVRCHGAAPEGGWTAAEESAFWTAQDQVRQRLARISADTSAPFVVDLDRLGGSGSPRARLCGGIDELLHSGLDRP